MNTLKLLLDSFITFIVVSCIAVLFPISAWAFTTITVNSNADDNVTNRNCTLREAIIAANTNTAVDACAAGSATAIDMILFDPSLDGKVIKLTNVGAGEDAALTGDLDILDSGNLVIQGNGAGKTIIDGNLGDRVFHVLSFANLTLKSMTIQHGAGVDQGAGIKSEPSSTLTLDSVIIIDNTATGGMSSNEVAGGGIYVSGNFSMVNSFVIGNKAESMAYAFAEGGGIAINTLGATYDIRYSSISNNVARSKDANTAEVEGGGIYCTDAIHLTDSVVSGNSAISETAGTLVFGGGIYTSTLTLERVELSNNMAENTAGDPAYGGGVASGDTIEFINATITGNQAKDGYGGGIFVLNAAANSQYAISSTGATIARNISAYGGGLYINGSVILNTQNTILADNTASLNGQDCGSDGTPSAGINTNGFNLIGISDGCTVTVNSSSDQVGTTASPIDPRLGSLQLVAGAPVPTRVLPLLPDSPAIDAGDPTLTTDGGTCQSPDQVGNPRPQDDNGDGTSACDIGAVEYVQASTSTSGGSGGGALDLWDISFLLGVAFVTGLTRRRVWVQRNF